ncbi:MAG TPA: trypsin-like serine protease [Bacteroidales bacterium]|nr:trypsin-like serine protease [Bacteroidales bacterium]
MRNILVALLLLIPISLSAQKVKLQLARMSGAGNSTWQILDDSNNSIITGDDCPGNDTVSFMLDTYKHYTLLVNVLSVIKPDTSLYSLSCEGEEIVFISSDISLGEHRYGFFTGIQPRGSKIIGGSTVSISGYPYQVFYVSGNYQCGGSIISHRWILTAAHCTKDESGNPTPASQMYIIVGADDPYDITQGKVYAVSQVYVHESYNTQSYDNDIALLKLSDSINFPNAAPIKLVTARDAGLGFIDPGVMTKVTGWGLTNVSSQTVPLTLQKVDLPIVATSVAKQVFGSIASSDLMAGYLNGNKDACNGDSGGPLTVNVLGETRVAGIVSWGSASCNSYGAYTNVSQFGSWIYSKTGIPVDFVPPVPSGDSILCFGAATTTYIIPAVDGATSYEWALYPSNVGTITGNSDSAVVHWDPAFKGATRVMVRVTRNGSVSEWAFLNVNIYTNTAIITQPKDSVVCEGTGISIGIWAVGNKLAYTWYRNDTVIAGYQTNTVRFNSALPANSGTYHCKVSGTCGTLFTNDISLTVYPATGFTYVPPDTMVAFSSNVSLSVRCKGHDLSYGWMKDNEVIAGTDSPELSLTDVSAKDIATYKVTATGTCGAVTGRGIYLYVREPGSVSTSEVFMWPNPAGDNLNIAISNSDLYTVRIASSSGKIVRQLSNCQYQVTIDVSGLAGGIYFVDVSSGSFRKSLKMVRK